MKITSIPFEIDNTLVEEFDSQFKNCHLNPACRADIREFLKYQQKKYNEKYITLQVNKATGNR